MTPQELLALFTTQVRLTDADVTPGHLVEWDGPVRRTYPADPTAPGAMIECARGIRGTDDEIERTIARQRDFFTARGQCVEWKTYATDEPADLPHRLARHGFTIEDPEVVMLGEASALVGQGGLPEGLRIIEVSSPADWAATAQLMTRVWGAAAAGATERYRAEQEADPGRLEVFAVVDAASGAALCYARLELTPGVDFAGLWGGSTDPDHRGRGLYRALTAHRARRAIERKHPLVRVDTSPDSRPILTRLGLHQVTTTIPCVLDPLR